MVYGKKRRFLVLLIIVFLLSLMQLVPFYRRMYVEYHDSLDVVTSRLQYQEKISQKKDVIVEQYNSLSDREKKMRSMLFSGENPELVSSRMRTELNAIARASGLFIDSMNLPKFSQSDEWLLITQTVIFNGSQINIFQFLRKLDESRFFLPVISLDVRHGNEDQMHCIVKIVGFSRLKSI